MFITTDPKCENCGHAWSQHHRRDLSGAVHFIKCQVRKAKDWSEHHRAYRKFEPCDCPAYRGQPSVRLEATPATCPHECQEGNSRCVHCGRIAPKVKKSR